MVLPSIASTADIQTLVDNIQQASKSYSPHADSVTSVAQRAAIRSAATQLLHAVTTPDEMSWKKSLAMTELVALRTALRLGIFGAMPADAAISNSSLASKVNATPSLVERLMRVLVGTGFCDQLLTGDDDDDHDHDNVAEPRYKHTKFSLGYMSTAAPGPGTFYQGIYDTYFRSTVNFDTWMLDHPTSTGQHGDPVSNTVNPFVSHYNPNPDTDTDATPWSLMPLYPENLRVFQICLEAMYEIIPPAGPFYDFSQFGADAGADDGRVQLVDVGGGYGRVITEIVTAHPGLDPARCVLQDVPAVIAMEETAAVRALGVQTMPVDFFASQPVTGARAYYFRFISHDYSDEDLHRILTTTAAAMAPDSKLLLADCVLPARLHEATISAAVLDSLMFCIGGRERSEAAFRTVLAAAGLRLLRVHRVPGRTGGVVESVKMDGA